MFLGGVSGLIRVVDVATGEQIGQHQAHDDVVYDLAVGLAGDVLVSVGGDNTLRVWDAESFLETRAIHSPKPMTRVAISPSGERVAASVGVAIEQWDLATGEPLLSLPRHSGAISAIDSSDDGSLVLTGSYDFSARLWDAESGGPRQEFGGHAGFVTSVDVGSGDRFLTGSQDGALRLFDMQRDDPTQEIRAHEERSSGSASPEPVPPSPSAATRRSAVGTWTAGRCGGRRTGSAEWRCTSRGHPTVSSSWWLPVRYA